MTIKGCEHIIEVLKEIRKKMMDDPDPILMERLQECVVLCREEICRKLEKANGV